MFDTFLKETKSGRRNQKGGKRMRDSSIIPYVYLRKLLFDFSVKKNFPLRIYAVNALKKREISVERKYWTKFYREFTDYLYDDLDCFDNYVGSCIKRLRAFFNYLIEEKDINVGAFHKKFYSHNKAIEIITYNGLNADYQHEVLKHNEGQFVNSNNFHTNSVEGFWSLLKRGIFGIYHSTSPKHLNKYCDEFSYRYNTRSITDGSRFTLSLINADERLTYKKLIQK